VAATEEKLSEHSALKKADEEASAAIAARMKRLAHLQVQDGRIDGSDP
jgi:hypothetical protein